LDKITRLIMGIENQYHEQLDKPRGYYEKIRIICKVLKQQKEIFETGKSVADRIVSI